MKPFKSTYTAKNVNEFFYFNVVNDINRKRFENGDALITVNQARGFRQLLLDALRTKPATKAYLDTIQKSSPTKESVSDHFLLGLMGTPKYVKDDAANALRVKELITSVNEVLPEAKVSVETYAHVANNLYDSYIDKKTDSKLTPLSPYDALMATREAALRNPGSLLLVDLSNVPDSDATGVGAVLEPAHELQTPVYTQFYDYNKTRVSDFYRNAGATVYSREDYYGLSALRPYMTTDNYNDVRQDFVDIFSSAGSRFSNESLQKSVDLLKLFNEKGYDYEISCKQSGELSASFTGINSGLKVTVVPGASHSFDSNFGKVYSKGLSYRFTTNKKTPARDANGNVILDANKRPKKVVDVYGASAEEAAALVDFALGNPVKRRDTSKLMVGQPNISKVVFGKTQEFGYYNDAYNGKSSGTNNMSYKYGTFDTNYSLYLSVDTSDARPRTMYFGGKKLDAAGQTILMSPEEAADNYLREAVLSARENYAKNLDLERMISESEAHQGDENYVFSFSKDDDVAKRQQVYWDVLFLASEEEAVLPVFGTEVEEFDDEHPVIQYYEGTKEEKVRQHVRDLIDAEIGSFDPDSNGKRFNPVGVSTHMTSGSIIARNNDNIVVALQLLGINAEELKGSDYYSNVVRNRLLRFDEDTAKPIMHHGNDFVRSMGLEIKTTIESSGCFIKDEDIRIDKNGIVCYEAEKVIGAKARDGKVPTPETESFYGYIGQIFAPDGRGTVTTAFGDGDNYMFVPGYTASVLPQKIGENLSFEERTRLKGYDQNMREAIRKQLREDMVLVFSNYEDAPRGTTTSLNRTYKHLYDVRHPVDYLERTAEEGMTEDFYDAVLETEARRVRYDSKFKDGATLNASYQASQRVDYRINDVNNNPLTLADQRNLAVMSEESDGYFDPDATSTGMNQGITRYLVEGATVNPDGSITKSNVPNDKTPLCKHPVMAWSEYVPFDRRQMVFNNVIKAQCITEKVKTAQMTFGGWTFDDGFVVTKAFADRYKVRGTNGDMRAIIVGDKILDKNGNKGVISLVLDTDMSEEDAKAQGLSEAVAWAKANPEIAVYGAPYPAVSRFNGGTARELMQSTSDLVNPHTNEALKGCVGEAEFIVTHMTVDEKTHVYDDESFQDGKGRRASAQLAWALNSKNAKSILREFYDSNDKAFTNMREYMIVCGYDMDETGKILDGYVPHEGEVRNVFAQAEVLPGAPTTYVREQMQAFRNQISKQGGFLEVPFQLKYPDDRPMPVLVEEEAVSDNATEHNIVYSQKTWTVTRNGKEYVAHRSAKLLEEGNVMHRGKEGATAEPKDPTYAVPILSSYLRVGQDYEDGSVSVHDYTLSYGNIYKKSMEYLVAKSKGDTAAMKKCKTDAQRSFNAIANDIVYRKFDSKYNAFKEEMMSNRLRDSATAVWTADPRLDIDALAVSREIATTLNLQEGEHVMTWRDPILRDAGVRYMKVKIDDALTGVAINPIMDKSYDGDFDGDSIAVVKLHTKEAKKEAMNEFSVAANLLDYGAKNEDGSYELMLNHSLDLKTAEFCRPEMKARFADITKAVNNFERAFREKTITSDALWVHRTDTVVALNKYVRDAFDHGFGESVVSYQDMPSHIKSVEEIVVSGAKGSYSKLADYGRYLGARWERGKATPDSPEPPILLDTVEDLGVPQTNRKDSLAVQYATSVKSSVGVAGKFSQRGIKAMRNLAPKAVLEMTYPVTQALLQAKHDPIDARQKYAILMSATRDVWKGYKLNQQQAAVVDETGHKVLNEDGTVKMGRAYVKVQSTNGGRPVFENGKAVYEPATKEEWIAQMKDIYLSKDMMNVAINPDYIDELADHLVDKSGYISNIEDDHVGSPMDRVAYKNAGTSAMVLFSDMAFKGEAIYDGEFNNAFMPRSVRRNVRTQQQNAVTSDVLGLKKYRPLAKSDTKSVNKTEKVPVSEAIVEKRRSLEEPVQTDVETPFSCFGGE